MVKNTKKRAGADIKYVLSWQPSAGNNKAVIATVLLDPNNPASSGINDVKIVITQEIFDEKIFDLERKIKNLEDENAKLKKVLNGIGKELIKL
jgi:hypothetical protein